MPSRDVTTEALLLITQSGTEVTDLMLSEGSNAVVGNAQLWVLISLRKAGPARPVHLADSLAMSTGGMTKVLDQLEGKELVRRLIDPEDGRGRIVVLTEKGLNQVDNVLVVLAPAIERLIDGFEALSAKASEIGNPGE